MVMKDACFKRYPSVGSECHDEAIEKENAFIHFAPVVIFSGI